MVKRTPRPLSVRLGVGAHGRDKGPVRAEPFGAQ